MFSHKAGNANKHDVDGTNYPGTAGYAGLDTDHPADVLLAIPPSNYLEFDPQTGTYSIRFYINAQAGTRSSLGSNLFQMHDLVFDLAMDRIGIAETDGCDMMVEVFGATSSSASVPMTAQVPLKGMSSVEPEVDSSEYSPILEPNEDGGQVELESRSHSSSAAGKEEVDGKVGTKNTIVGEARTKGVSTAGTGEADKEGGSGDGPGFEQKTSTQTAEATVEEYPGARKQSAGEYNQSWSAVAIFFFLFGFLATFFLSRPPNDGIERDSRAKFSWFKRKRARDQRRKENIYEIDWLAEQKEQEEEEDGLQRRTELKNRASDEW